MDMQPVESSNITAIGYDADSKTMRVRFKSGGEYEYRDVDSRVFRSFMEAPSKGRFFAGSVKGKYDGRKVETEPEKPNDMPIL